MKTKLVYRTATNKDSEKIIELVKKILPEFDLSFDPESSENDLLDIENTYINNGGVFLIIENSNSEIIGTAALLKVDEKTAKLKKMYVDKRYRNQGLGKSLLERILRKATELDFEEITLETVHTMQAAINLYQKYGFEKVNGCNAASPRCDIIMSKNLIED